MYTFSDTHSCQQIDMRLKGQYVACKVLSKELLNIFRHILDIKKGYTNAAL